MTLELGPEKKKYLARESFKRFCCLCNPLSNVDLRLRIERDDAGILPHIKRQSHLNVTNLYWVGTDNYSVSNGTRKYTKENRRPLSSKANKTLPDRRDWASSWAFALERLSAGCRQRVMLRNHEREYKTMVSWITFTCCATRKFLPNLSKKYLVLTYVWNRPYFCKYTSFKASLILAPIPPKIFLPIPWVFFYAEFTHTLLPIYTEI